MLLSELIRAVERRSEGRLPMVVDGADVSVSGFMSPDKAQAGHLAFLTDAKYAAQLPLTKASVLVLREKDKAAIFPNGSSSHTFVITPNPYAFFAWATQEFMAPQHTPGVHPSAVIDSTATLDSTVMVGPNVTIGAHAKIGARTRIHAGVVIEAGVSIGDDCELFPRVVVMHQCVLKNRVMIQPGAVIGADGFGFAPFEGTWIKIPQVGRVVLEDDVEIGANTTIDRGAIGDTVIDVGTKLDNQIQIGHNVRVGKHCVMAACAGIAGSTEVGDHVMIGGAAMINGHIKIPSGSGVGPATPITGWGSEPAQKTGFFPAIEGRQFQLTAAIVERLPEMRQTVRQLKKEVEGLRDEVASLKQA